MIELKKGDKPAWILANQERKTTEYLNAPTGKKPTPWRATEIVTALKKESSNKCMYCECTIDDAAYSAVEHILPKSLFENSVLEWENLGLVCPRCNTNKGDYWTANTDHQLLNPYQDSVNEHIDFCGPLTVARLDSLRGKNTVRKFKFLDRGDLLFSRMKSIQDLDAKLFLWNSTRDPELKDLFAEDVVASIAHDQEFSGVLRAYAIHVGFPVNSSTTL